MKGKDCILIAYRDILAIFNFFMQKWRKLLNNLNITKILTF